MDTFREIQSHLSTVDTISIIAGVAVSYVAYMTYSYRKTYSFWSKRGVKGPTPLPFFGNSLSYIFNETDKIDISHRNIYGKLYGIYDGSFPILMCSDPDIIEKIWITDHNSFKYHSNETPTDDMAHTLFGKRGNDVKRIRSIFTSGVTSSKLKGYLNIISTDALMKYVAKNEGKEVNAYDMFSIHILDIVLQIFYGLDLNLFENADHESIKHGKEIFTIYNALPSFLAANLPLLFKSYPNKTAAANEYYFNLIAFAMNERKRLISEGKLNGKKMVDFCQQFVDADFMTEMEKLANATLVLGAGFDSTAVTLSTILYELATNKCTMKKLVDEIDAVYADKSDENISYDDIANMTYLEQCFKETLRLHSIDVRAIRSATVDTKIPGTEIPIPADTVIMVPNYALHTDPQVFENPDVFDPDRWSDGRKDSIKPCAFMSFGAGPRKCPAGIFALMNVKVTLVSLLRKFTVDVCNRTNVAIPVGSFQAIPRNIWIKFIERS